MDIREKILRFFGFADPPEQIDYGDGQVASVAYNLLAQHIAISYVSNAISMCEFKVYRDGKPVQDELYYALNVSPNPNQDAAQFKAKLVEEAFKPKGPNNGSLLVQPVERRNYLYIADGFQREEVPLGEDLFRNVVLGKAQINKEFKASDVCHFVLDNESTRARIDDTYKQLAKMLGMSEFSFKNANGERFIYEKEQRPGGTRRDEKDAADELRDRLRSFTESANGVLPMKAGNKLTRLEPSGSGSSSDFIALRKDIFELTANAWKIPTAMMYGNMTNTKDIIDQFITFGVDPNANKISREMTRKFYDFHSWNGGENRIFVDTSTINHADLFSVAASIEKLVGSATFTPNEVRLALGYDKLDLPEADMLWITKNFSRFDADELSNAEGGEK